MVGTYNAESRTGRVRPVLVYALTCDVRCVCFTSARHDCNRACHISGPCVAVETETRRRLLTKEGTAYFIDIGPARCQCLIKMIQENYSKN